MLEALFYRFIEEWLMGLIAFIAGRYIGVGDIKLPSSIRRVFLLFLKVWALTFLWVIVFSSLGHLLHWREHIQSGFAEFLLPLVVSAYFARWLMHYEMKRDK